MRRRRLRDIMTTDPETPPMQSEIVSDNGKGSLFYRVHPYPTKVPPSILKRLIEHYTRPGDLVVDPFCGSGATGYAAKLAGRDFSVSDLSPYAVHIARGYTESCPPEAIDEATDAAFETLSDLRGTYETRCRSCEGTVEGRYWVWSWAFACPDCGGEWTLDPDEGQSGRGKVTCPDCGEEHAQSNVYTGRDVPLRVAYKCSDCHTKAVEDPVTADERERLLELEATGGGGAEYDRAMMHVEDGADWGDQYRDGNHEHVDSVSSFFTGRNWGVLVDLWEALETVEDDRARRALEFAFTASIYTSSKMVRCRPNRDGRSNNPGTLYLPPLALEQNVFRVFERRVKKVRKLKRELAQAEEQGMLTADGLATRGEGSVSVRDARDLADLDDESVDFVVTDPPFGDSLQYAELNFIPESFIGTFTEAEREIVVNETRSVEEEEYLDRMGAAFAEAHRVLKPGRYLCIIFNNTSPLVWAGMKRQLLDAGFELPSVTGIVKGHASKNQTVYAGSTSRFDPVFHARKPASGEASTADVAEYSAAESEELAVDVAVSVIEEASGDEYADSIAYVHSRVTQRLLEMDAVVHPPSPKTLQRLLDEADGAGDADGVDA